MPRNGSAKSRASEPDAISELRARHPHQQPHEESSSSSSDQDEHQDPAPTTTTTRARRPSTTELLLHKAAELETTIATALTHLLHWDDLPAWRRDNPSILRGYRPTSNSFRASLHSLLHVHNETVNIWTHLLGCLAFFGVGVRWLVREVVAPRYETATSGDAVAFGCFFAGATVCLGASAAFHTLSNHSERVAKWGNKLDYSGIVFLIVGSYVAPLWYGFYCEAGLLTLYLGLISLLGLGCLVVSWFDHFRMPEWRPYRTLMFVGLGASGVIPILHTLTRSSFADLHQRMGLGWVLLQGILYIIGAFIYAVRFPERKWPGVFDIWGSSHQIFHVFVIVAAATHLYGMIAAFDHHHGIRLAQCDTVA
ncbi:hypothetical protein VTJ49DRAFT_3443 [Mycothermus thermophilus]|uniref:Uncharacterized protein n=1 Tax=Humicola insolens TaxID=85995 RepID=A0ABR3V7M9_HUMIN